MPASMSKLGAVFLGAIAGMLAVAILVLVPVWGVRKELELIVVDWQEFVLYSSCLLAGTVGGARLAFQAHSRMAASSREYASFLSSNDVEPEVENGENHERLSPSDDELPLLTEPVFEESLSGGPRKAKKGFWTAKNKGRTTALLMVLYLVLFVMCAVLCQKLGLGNIVSDPVSAEAIRTVGVGTAVIGLYLITRGMFARSNSDMRAEPKASSGGADNDEPDKSVSKETYSLGGEFPSSIVHDSETFHAPHVPPSKIVFLRRHPVCAGWLVVLTGLPLVFQAWFPLLAIPGLFIGMNWLFPDKSTSYR
jgi:protein-S-isoprenylcysteine O-methyltransferase Ste14